MDNYAKTKYRYFFFSFSAAFFMLSITFLFLVAAVRPSVPETLISEPDIDDAASAYIPKKEDTMTVLLISGAEAEAGTGTFMLVRFDPVSGKVPVIVLPPETAVLNAGDTETIEEVYRYGGAEYLKETLSETLMIPIDKYIKLDMKAFLRAAEMVGFVEFDLPEEIEIIRSGVPSVLTRGTQLLDGQKAADVMTYHKYSGGDETRLLILGELTAAIINQRMDICLSTVFDNVFEDIVDMVSTDISYHDYYTRKPAAEFLAKLGNSPAYTVEPVGERGGDGSLFVLDNTFIAGLSQFMR